MGPEFMISDNGVLRPATPEETANLIELHHAQYPDAPQD